MEQKYSETEKTTSKKNSIGRRLLLFSYDFLLFAFSFALMFAICNVFEWFTFAPNLLLHIPIAAVCLFISRHVFSVYKKILRYGGSSVYLRLIVSDFIAGSGYYILQRVLPIPHLAFLCILGVFTINLILSMAIRLLYVVIYELLKRPIRSNNLIWKVACFFARVDQGEVSSSSQQEKIRVAIVGAGRVGAMLADELCKNPNSTHTPCCFIDVDRSKIGRDISDIPVLSEEESTPEKLAAMKVQEIVFALPQATAERKKVLYEHYKQTGCRIRVYDYPVMQNAANSKRTVRDFDIEELLFRMPVEFRDEKTSAYYRNKVVLITGGGGSIGSELCRQIAQMQPKCLIILDVYENGAYDVQQELRIAYGDKLNLHVEIVSVCDRSGFEKVFSTYHPDILLHAAAHKHVPLMEHNCCEAVKNNVFGTLNAVELSEKYKVGRFIMVSTDKAVNPTNVMGATKRMCEMIVQSHSQNNSGTVYSATRFGNVLGSAGSVIPLFKRQIMNGGPITLTDKRIIRYFMTIPEASQLVLQSGAMAKNGELFVLDMGNPIKILDLATNMIRLSGYEPYEDIDIIETGLRPGEKLYEELLIRTEELDKTDNSMIFIERDQPLPLSEIEEKLNVLRRAILTEDDLAAKSAMRQVVPTFYTPEEVNRFAVEANEMKIVAEQTSAGVGGSVS